MFKLRLRGVLSFAGAVLFAACAGPWNANAVEPAPAVNTATTANTLLGAWSRDTAACDRPEFNFKPQLAEIQTDADGAPISFRYPAVVYVVEGKQVQVKLGKPHPLGKTADKTSLQFVLQAEGRADLQLRDQRTVSLVRCVSPAAH